MAAIPLAPLGATGGTSLVTDARSLDGLRRSAGQDPKTAAREAAKQFESLFMNELMKTMRASTQASGMLDNAGTKLGTEMLDAQLVSKMAGQPGSLSDVIAKQLERQMALVPGPIPSVGSANKSLPIVSLPAGAKLADVVRALNTLGATPADLQAILQAMKAAGALNAELEVI